MTIFSATMFHMQTQDCTYTNDGGTPPTIVSSHCSTVGTSTVALASWPPESVVAYDPFVDVSLGILLWIVVCLVIVILISKFR